jgi:hypothetical protein
MQGRDPVTGKMPVPQVLLLKWKHYILEKMMQVDTYAEKYSGLGDWRDRIFVNI